MYREGSVDCVIKVVLLHAIQGPGMLYGKHTTKGPELLRCSVRTLCQGGYVFTVCLFIYLSLCILAALQKKLQIGSS